MGGVVKANGRANLTISTFVREDSTGLLVDRSSVLRHCASVDDDVLPLFINAITTAAMKGNPYTKTGRSGVYKRRFEMPSPLHDMGKHRLARWVDDLLASGQLISAMAKGSNGVKWLDVPGGAFARGEGQLCKHISQQTDFMMEAH